MEESNKVSGKWRVRLDRLKRIFNPPDKRTLIQNELLKLNSKLILQGTSIIDKNRQSQIFTGLEDGSTSIDFWENGICWHSQLLTKVTDAALAAYLWNDVRANSTFIEKEISTICFIEGRKQIEISSQEYIKWRWENLVYSENDLENELICLLKRDDRINRLMTFHQLWDLGLSRYIGHYGDQLKNDLLRAKVQNGTIEVRTEEMARKDYSNGGYQCLGKGDAKTAYKAILDNLPSDIDWAEYQTLEQYIARTGAPAS
ncbi:hypothetical protein [Paraflavitalea sp. CAU 1676]|uniref:hypothetical protein n=1 Tax=Paraflavitalea sp. CAU 1676 TaxID=3032598 RepID=UPI0023DC3142|nr:hypothetical protein [Paraflavitalea sp. CAU 1676]MDF2188435.1 hypothetical protein [Paraflavitalea sp. CAU 1676]